MRRLNSSTNDKRARRSSTRKMSSTTLQNSVGAKPRSKDKPRGAVPRALAAAKNDEVTQMNKTTNDSSKELTKKETSDKIGKARSLAGIHKVLQDFLANTLSTGVDGFRKEFKELKTSLSTTFTADAFHSNKDKNRYNDVLCLDSSRVILHKGEAEEMYIHASHVTGGGSKRWICAQGPTEKTLIDFWMMVWEQEVSVIVMLCSIVENGRKKCEQYWPEKSEEQATHGTISVFKTSEELRLLCDGKRMTVSVLEVTLEGCAPRTVKHCLVTHWPDRSAPTDTRLIIKVHKYVGDLMGDGQPAIVHCSAGIGRTGTFVVIDRLMTLIANPEDKEAAAGIVIKDILKKVREERVHSVQTEVQYVFIHMSAIDYICLKWLSFPAYTTDKTPYNTVPNYDQFRSDYVAMLPRETKETKETKEE